jgi:ATP-dependent Clp protease adaptor protein ClpS
MSRSDENFEGRVVAKVRRQLEEPPLFRVLLYNDDYTTMEFVVLILEKVFQKSTAEATRIMLNVHQQGVGVAGVFTRDVAETKVAIVLDLARKNEYPLKCTMEKL